MGGYAVYLILHKPMLNIRPARQADLPPPPEAADSAPPPCDIPWPLQRHKSRESIQVRHIARPALQRHPYRFTARHIIYHSDDSSKHP
jgi:hypothetical protein